MTTTQYSFWHLLEVYRIEIPMIQRDYAQGRKDPKVDQIRSKILLAIKQSFENSSPLDFDFIYGDIIDDETKFIPIDGQQRLTTLFLLHWYSGYQESNYSQEIENILAKFTYQTRIGSAEFCHNLVTKKDFHISDKSLSEEIKDCNWYRKNWEKDPTVSAMLTMLDEIHHTFRNMDLWDRLIHKENPQITFQFKPMKELDLDDNIYIRMNSRGRLLTDFENFKALFEQFLEHKHPDYLQDFSDSIDIQWTDFLWNYKKDNLIDEPFLNLFEYISELIYYKYFYEKQEKTFQKYKKEEIDYWKSIYEPEESIQFLFSFINTLLDIDKSYNKKLLDNVPLFDDPTTDNPLLLILRCLEKKSFEIPAKIILYCLVQLNSKDVKIEENEIWERVRSIRNRLLRVRQFQWPQFGPVLRYEHFTKYLIEADKLVNIDGSVYQWYSEEKDNIGFPSDTIELEQWKANCINQDKSLLKTINAIEDDCFFKGAIFALKEIDDYENLPLYYEYIKSLHEADHQKLSLAFLTIDDFYGFDLYGWSTLGIRSFISSNDWYQFFSQNNPNLPLKTFLEDYRRVEQPGDKVNVVLQKMIDNWKKETTDNSLWPYYFFHYPEYFWEEEVLFAWKDNNSQFEIECLMDKEYQQAHKTARGKHINPYVYSVVKELNRENICSIEQCYGIGTELSCIVIDNLGMNLYCIEEGWKIELIDEFSIPESLIRKYRLSQQNDDSYLLQHSSTCDRIQDAKDFISELINDH